MHFLAGVFIPSHGKAEGIRGGRTLPHIITTWHSMTYISLQYPWHCCMNSSGALHSFGNEPHWRGFTGCIWQRFFSVRNMHAPSSFSRKTSPRRSRASFVYPWMSSSSEIPRNSAIFLPSSGRYLTCPSQRQQAPQHRQWKTFIFSGGQKMPHDNVDRRPPRNRIADADEQHPRAGQILRLLRQRILLRR